MNNARRKRIEKINEQLSGIKQDLEEINEEEENCRDNMPENLQESEKYEASENASGCIEYAIDNISDTIDNLNESVE